MHLGMLAESLQSCPTHCDPMDAIEANLRDCWMLRRKQRQSNVIKSNLSHPFQEPGSGAPTYRDTCLEVPQLLPACVFPVFPRQRHFNCSPISIACRHQPHKSKRTSSVTTHNQNWNQGPVSVPGQKAVERGQAEVALQKFLISGLGLHLCLWARGSLVHTSGSH